jgi:hypothetical protein
MPSKKRRKKDLEECMDDPYYRMWIRQCWVTRLWNMRNQLVIYHADDHLNSGTLIEADELLRRLIHILKGL